MAPLVWTPGAPAPALPAPLPEPQAPVAMPAGVIAPVGTAGAQAHLVAEIGAFRQQLRHFLRSNAGQQSKLTAAGGGVVGDPQVQTAGHRAGAIVQKVRLGSREYHIYFHPDGRREVIAMPKTPALTGGLLAPS